MSHMTINNVILEIIELISIVIKIKIGIIMHSILKLYILK